MTQPIPVDLWDEVQKTLEDLQLSQEILKTTGERLNTLREKRATLDAEIERIKAAYDEALKVFDERQTAALRAFEAVQLAKNPPRSDADPSPTWISEPQK